MTIAAQHLVDVVIPTRDRPERLRRCLEALARQSFTQFRVIVVDDASEPAAELRLSPLLRERLGVMVLRLPRNSGPAHARNVGVAAGSAPYVAFIDDDVEPAPEMLHRLMEAMEAADSPAAPVAVVGVLLEPADWQPRPWNLWEARKLRGLYEQIMAGRWRPSWRQFFTGCTLVRRDSIIAAGGFDPRFTRAEDIELGIRLEHRGVSVVVEPRAIGWHHADRSLEGWREIPREYARFDVAIDSLYPHLERLAEIDHDLRRRNPAEVMAGVIFGRAPMRRLGAGLALSAARALWALRMRSISMYGFSLAYDIEYRASLRSARREPSAVLAATRPLARPVGMRP